MAFLLFIFDSCICVFLIVHSYHKNHSFSHVFAQATRFLLPNLLNLLKTCLNLNGGIYAWLEKFAEFYDDHHVYTQICSILSSLPWFVGVKIRPSTNLRSSRAWGVPLSNGWVCWIACAPGTAEQPRQKNARNEWVCFWMFLVREFLWKTFIIDCLKVCSFQCFHSLLQALVTLG